MEELNTAFRDKKIELLYRQSQAAILSTSLASIVLTVVFWQLVSPEILLSWCGLLLAFNTVRYYFINNFNISPATIKDKRPWLNYYIAGAVISGCFWGLISLYILLAAPLQFSALVMLMLGYLVIGASITYSPFLSVFAAFTTPLIVPVIGYLLIYPDYMIKALGGMLVLLFLYSINNALRYREMTLSYITYQFENRTLFDHLLQEKAAASRLNEELEEEVDKLRRTEEKLKHEKRKAQELARTMARISVMDSLTGIANRRQFDESLSREWNRARRSRIPLSLILCDIDHFKDYNDCYGHQQGDRCLIKVAHVIQDYARRAGDVAVRYGGEEFALILPETNLDNATEIANQIRDDIAALRILHYTSETSDFITVSFGVATVMPEADDETSHVLVSMADKALYEAKQSGRNQVITALPKVEETERINYRAS